jgi:hypothetical protein
MIANSLRPWSSATVRAARAAGRFLLADRRRVFFVAVAALGLGLALNWSWLVAAGIAPLIVGMLPCAAMCAVGLCMGGSGNRSCAKESTLPPTATEPGKDSGSLRINPERN